MADRTLLAVHAHPDDETITMGGTLARYSAEGVRTIVVTCTTGNLGAILDPGLSAAEGVGALRQRELEAATRRLGISRTVQLGYADSGMAGWPENNLPDAFWASDAQAAAALIVDVLREERPQVMVACDETGGYGHPDHIKSHHVALAAFQSSGEAQPLKLYFVRFPLTWSRQFVRLLRAEGIDAPASAPAGADAGPGVHEIGVADDLVTTAIDVRAFVGTKRSALACHASQMPPDHFLRLMPDHLAEQLWAFEFFSREVGPTTVAAGQREDDLFCGLA